MGEKLIRRDDDQLLTIPIRDLTTPTSTSCGKSYAMSMKFSSAKAIQVRVSCQKARSWAGLAVVCHLCTR